MNSAGFILFYFFFFRLVSFDFCRVAQVGRDPSENPEGASAGLLLKGGIEDLSAPSGGPPDSEFGGLVSYFSSQQEDFEES